MVKDIVPDEGRTGRDLIVQRQPLPSVAVRRFCPGGHSAAGADASEHTGTSLEMLSLEGHETRTQEKWLGVVKSKNEVDFSAEPIG